MLWFMLRASVLILPLIVFSHVVAQEPVLTVTEPVNGQTVEGLRVVVEFNVEGIDIVPSDIPVDEAGQRPEANNPGEGHVHLLLDLQPMVILEHDGSYTFEGVPPGDHELMVEIVQNDHSSLDSPVMRHIHFQSEAAQLVPATGSRLTSPLYLSSVWLRWRWSV